MLYGLEGHKVLTVLNTRQDIYFGTKFVFQPKEVFPKIHILSKVKKNITNSIFLYLKKNCYSFVLFCFSLGTSMKTENNNHFQIQNTPGENAKKNLHKLNLLKTTFRKFIIKKGLTSTSNLQRIFPVSKSTARVVPDEYYLFIIYKANKIKLLSKSHENVY